MNSYLLLKWLHILSSMLLFGTGIGSAFYLLFGSLSRDVRGIALIARLVVMADWCFTAPTVIFQPVSGIYLARLAGYPLHEGWVMQSMVLYGFAVACWLPVLWIQLRMRDAAATALRSGGVLAPRYWRYLALWSVLGTLAFLALMAVIYLMVIKPA
jgi:uncharacterized membrane protein